VEGRERGGRKWRFYCLTLEEQSGQFLQKKKGFPYISSFSVLVGIANPAYARLLKNAIKGRASNII